MKIQYLEYLIIFPISRTLTYTYGRLEPFPGEIPSKTQNNLEMNSYVQFNTNESNEIKGKTKFEIFYHLSGFPHSN